MSKHDFPQDWPDLLSGLLEATTGAENASSLLTALHYVVKCLADLKNTAEYGEFEDADMTIRKAYDVKMAHLREHAPSIVMGVVTKWGEMTARLGTQITAFLESGGRSGIDPHLAYDCLFAFRILSTLLTNHLPTLSTYNQDFFVDFCTMLATRIESLWSLVKETQSGYPAATYINKLYKKLVKFIVDIQILHPLTFTPVLLSFMNYFLKEYLEWKDEWRGIAALESPLIQYMRFFSQVLGTQDYTLKHLEQTKLNEPRKDPDVEIATEEAIMASSSIVTTFFSHQTLVYMLQTIIARFFKIPEDRFEIWMEAPDQFYEEDIDPSTATTSTASASSGTIRQAAENLFIQLFRYDENAMITECLRLIAQVRSNCAKEVPENVPLSDILLKDACMSTLHIGYLTFCMSNAVTFEEMQTEMLELDLANADPRYRVIRKTIACIISAWAEDIPQEIHKHTWELLLTLLSDTDTIVKYYAIRAINDLLVEIDFDYEPYSSCIRPTIDLILGFLRDMQASSFAKRILEQLNQLVYHLRDRISPYTSAIVGHITEFWNIADQRKENDMKQPIITILASLCESLPDYSNLYETLLHVAQQTTDLDHPDSVLLLESGMRLWWNMLQKSDGMTDDLANMFPRVGYIFSKVPISPNISSLTVRLMESYMILGGVPFVQKAIGEVAEVTEALVAHANSTLIVATLDLLVTYIRLFPDEARHIAPALVRTYQTIFYKYPARTKILLRAITVFQNLVIRNLPFWLEFLSEPSLNSRRGQYDEAAPLPLLRLVNRSLEVYSLIEYIEPLKMWASAMSVLFACGNPMITPFLPALLDATVYLILDLRRKTKNAETRKRMKEQSDVITIKDSTVDKLRIKLESEDISRAAVPDIEKFVLQNIVSTLQNNGQEFEQQIATAVNDETRKFLLEELSS